MRISAAPASPACRQKVSAQSAGEALLGQAMVPSRIGDHCPWPGLAVLVRAAAAQGYRLELCQSLPPWALRILPVGLEVRLLRGERLLGVMKAWSQPLAGIHLDTLQVQPGAGRAGLWLWGATLGWCLEGPGLRHAWLLAIDDGVVQHRRLLRYFGRLGFVPLRQVRQRLVDVPDLLLWGGTGCLMVADVQPVLEGVLARLSRWIDQSGQAAGQAE